jgi:hypothetical protein
MTLAESPRVLGDSLDNALAETVIGLFKTEVIRRRGPLRSIDDVEPVVLEWVDLFNPPTAPRAHRDDSTRRARSRLLPSDRHRGSADRQPRESPVNPARLKLLG